MRRIEACATDSGRRRAQMIEECREVLGANSLSLCHLRQDGELAFLNIAGNPPDPDTVREIVARVSRRSRQWFSAIERREFTDVALAGRGSDLVCAVMPQPAQPWAEDFVAFIAERFIRTRTTIAPDTVSARNNLALPANMIVGPSASMKRLLEQMRATVGSGLDVLLTGETGTGKELFAHLVHDSGPTRNGPFIAINCAAIPSELLEAELFGVQKRIATGVDPRPGLFVEADKGSMFLDEVGELPERLQAKLLRVLQEREVLALGATRPRKIAVRVVSACNRNLLELVQARAFRADLYYRLRGLEFHIPALRERREDIPSLAIEFANRAAESYGKSVLGITNGALELLQDQDWPGNVRELQSEIRRAVLVCESEDSLDIAHFSSLSIVARQHPTTVEIQGEPAKTGLSLREQLDSVERTAIERAMVTAQGNHSRAARLLGITRNGLSHKLRRLGIRSVPADNVFGAVPNNDAGTAQ